MDLYDRLTEDDKNRIYESFSESEIDGHPYIKLADKETFFGAEPDLKVKAPSLLKRLYHTFRLFI